MIKEFCSENHVAVVKLFLWVLKELELCDNLAVGGTTPSYASDQTCLSTSS